jgi:hypothetical protein
MAGDEQKWLDERCQELGQGWLYELRMTICTYKETHI